jgi:hypothetical protein
VVCEVCGRRLTASAARRIGPVCERRVRDAQAAPSTSRSRPPVDPAAAEAAGQLPIDIEDQEQHATQ